jgi:hypothetical protein
MKSYFKNSILLNKIIFYLGYYYFKLTNKTLYYSNMSMVNLYCLTNGAFSNNLNFGLKPRKRISFKGDIFELITEDFFSKTNNTLNNDGYSLLKTKLPHEIIEGVMNFSLNSNSYYTNKSVKIDFKNLESNIYKYKYEDLINNKFVQRIIADPVLINIARNYFNSEPVFDFVSMWWTTDYEKKVEDAAQEYHFDCDRVKWLKVFFYINDVTEENGPHCYIKSSHKIGSKPQEILSKGYVRIQDSILKECYSKDNFIEATGESGTILIGDTSCWHKGKPISKGSRLLLQLEFTTSLFGIHNPKGLVTKYESGFKEFCLENKHYSQKIKFN